MTFSHHRDLLPRAALERRAPAAAAPGPRRVAAGRNGAAGVLAGAGL